MEKVILGGNQAFLGRVLGQGRLGVDAGPQGQPDRFRFYPLDKFEAFRGRSLGFAGQAQHQKAHDPYARFG